MLTEVKLDAMHHLEKPFRRVTPDKCSCLHRAICACQGSHWQSSGPKSKEKGQLPTCSLKNLKCVVALLCSMPMICMCWARYQFDLLEIIVFHKVKLQRFCNGMSVSYMPTCHVLSWLHERFLIACAWCCSSKRGWKDDWYVFHLLKASEVRWLLLEWSLLWAQRAPASKCLFSAKSGIFLFWPSMNDWVRWTCSQCMSSQFGWTTVHVRSPENEPWDARFNNPFQASLDSIWLSPCQSFMFLYICQQHLVVYFLKLASMKIRNFSVQQVCGVLISRWTSFLCVSRFYFLLF